jgi:hypothetical protein
LIKAQLTEKYKITIIFILLVIALFLTYYFHAILKTGIIFTHFFYIPIILAAIWWKRKGLVVAILLILVLFLGVFFIDKRVPGIDDMARALMFLVISSVVIILSEKISKNEELLQKAHDELNLRVKERTFELTVSNEKLINEIEEHKHAQEELNKLNTLLEQRVRERTAELENKNDDLETMLKAFVGREMRMADLKNQIDKLEKELPDNTKSA